MPQLQPLAWVCFLLATLTSAAGVRGNDVTTPGQPQSREFSLVHGVESTSLGCFKDRPHEFRVFGRRNSHTQIHMTPDSCASLCLGKGIHKYYGLQNGNECWCGTAGVEIDKWGALPQQHCEMPCAGNKSKKCGGNMSFKAFQFGASPPPPDHLGCFEDDHCGRIFSKPAIEMNRKNTAENCKAACGPRFAYYGLQRGDECWCGKADEDFDKHGASDECAHRCTGDHKAVCGGFNAMNVFVMHCAE
ncbi:unnamed protein product [Pylaiella littoralis]